MAPSRRSQRTQPPAANTRSSRRASQPATAGSSTTTTRSRTTAAAAAKSSAKGKAKPKASTPAQASKAGRQSKASKPKPEPESADDQSDSESEDDESGSDSQVDDDQAQDPSSELAALTHEVVEDEEEAAGFVRRSTRRRVSSDIPLVVMPAKAPVAAKKDKDKESSKAAVPTAAANAGGNSSGRASGGARRGSAATAPTSASSSSEKQVPTSTRSTRRKSSSAPADLVVVEVPAVKSSPIKRVYGKKNRRMSASSQLPDEDAMDVDVDVDVVTLQDDSGRRRSGTDSDDHTFLRPCLPCPSSDATVTDRSTNASPTAGTIPTGLATAAARCATESTSPATIRPKPKGIKRVGKRRRLEDAAGRPGTSVGSASSSDRDATATPPLLHSISSRTSSASHSPVIFGTPRNSVQGLAARHGQSVMNAPMDVDFAADLPAGAATAFAQGYQQQHQRHPHLASPDSAMDLTSPVHNHRTHNPTQYPHSAALEAWNLMGFHPLPNQLPSPTNRDLHSQQLPLSPSGPFDAAFDAVDLVDGRPQKRARTDSLSLVSPNAKSASQTIEEAAAALLMFSSATSAQTSSDADADVSPTTAASDLSGPPTHGPFSPPLDHPDMDMQQHNHNPFASAWTPHSPTSTMFAMPPPPPPPSSAAHSPEHTRPAQSQAFPSITIGWPLGGMPSMGPTPPPTAIFDPFTAMNAPISPTFHPLTHPQMRRMSIESMTGFSPGLPPPLYRRMSMDSTAAGGAGMGMGGYYTDDEDNMLISPVMRSVELRSPSPFTDMNGGKSAQQPNSSTNGTDMASGSNGQSAAQSPTYAPFYTNGVPMDAARIAAVIDAVRRPHIMQPTLPAAGIQTWAQLFQRQPGAAAAPNASAAAALVSAQPPASMAAVLANLDVIPEEGVVPFTLEQLSAMAAGLDDFAGGMPGIAPAAAGGSLSAAEGLRPDAALSAPNSAASTPTMSRQRPTILAQTPAPMVHHAPDVLRDYAKQMADQYQLARTVADPVTTRAIMLHIVLADPQRPTTLPELINAFPHVDPLTVVHTCEMLADRPYAVARELDGQEVARVKDRLVKQVPAGQAQADVNKLQVVSLCKVAVIRGKGYRLDELYGLMVKRDGAAGTPATAAAGSGGTTRRIPTGYTNGPNASQGQLTIPTTLLSCTTKGRRRFLRYKDGHTYVHGYELPAIVVAHTRSATEATPGTVAQGASAAAASTPMAPAAAAPTSPQASEAQPAAASAAASTQANEPMAAAASSADAVAQTSTAAPTSATEQQTPASEAGTSTDATPAAVTSATPSSAATPVAAAAAIAASATPDAAATAPTTASEGATQGQPDRHPHSPVDDAALGLPVAPSPGMYTPAVRERYLNAVTSARWTGRPADALKMLINLGPDTRLSHRDVIARFGSDISLSTLTVALMYSWARPLLPVEEIPKEAKPELWDAIVAHVPAGTDTSNMRLYLSIGLECEGLEQPWAECVVPTVNDRKYYLREWYVLVEGPQLVYADGTTPTVAPIPGGAASSSEEAAAGAASASGSARVGAAGPSRSKSSGSKKSAPAAGGPKSLAGASGSKPASASASSAVRPAPAAAAPGVSRPPSAASIGRTPASTPSIRPVPPSAPTAAAGAPAGAAAAVPGGPRPIAPSTAGSRLLNAVAAARLPPPSSSSRTH